MSLKRIYQRHLGRVRSGQALVEYALILVMVAVLFAVTLAATGPPAVALCPSPTLIASCDAAAATPVAVNPTGVTPTGVADSVFPPA